MSCGLIVIIMGFADIFQRRHYCLAHIMFMRHYVFDSPHTYRFCQSMSYTTQRHHHDVDSCEHPSLGVNTRQYLSLYQCSGRRPSRSVHLPHQTGCTSCGHCTYACCQPFACQYRLLHLRLLGHAKVNY